MTCLTDMCMLSQRKIQLEKLGIYAVSYFEVRNERVVARYLMFIPANKFVCGTEIS